MLLKNKFGVAIGICNQLSLGWGTREQRTLSWKIHTKMVYQKKKEWKRGKQWKIRVTLNSIVPTCYKCSLVPLQIVSRVNEGIESIL